MELQFCQSCGMPMTAPEHFGINKDGSVNNDYCSYCFKDGAFTQDLTMEEMIHHCTQFLEEFNDGSDIKMTKEEAINQMKAHFPTLKRWSKF